MRIVFISDTHCYHNKVQLPDGDVLVHAGDISGQGEFHVIKQFNKWIAKQSFSNTLVVAGNHDRTFESDAQKAESLLTNCRYLRDSEVVIDGFKFYGSPWQPEFCNWAFNLPRDGKRLREVWSQIPTDTDVLITHGPPSGTLDFTLYDREHAGCAELARALQRVQPAVHVFGHIHEGYGVISTENTLYVNASICTLNYEPSNKPIWVDLEKIDGKVKVVNHGYGN